MRVSRFALIPVLLFTACTDEPVAPDAGLIQAAKGGNKGKPGGGDDDQGVTITQTDLGTLDGRSWSTANGVVSAPDGFDVRVVGKSGDGAFYWTP